MTMPDIPNIEGVRNYFGKALSEYGATAEGADRNSTNSQEIRFAQLIKVINEKAGFTILDYGCGYGALAEYLGKQGYSYNHFYGFDILEPMISEASRLHPDSTRYTFTTNFDEIAAVDYTVASGVFNARLDTSYEEWTDYVIETLHSIDKRSRKGFAVNFLTKYSDLEKMQDRLYYADPGYLFDYCKKNISFNVALLHDYGLYDFTLIIRKNA
jgi:SAM-dependent methyltransferase